MVMRQWTYDAFVQGEGRAEAVRVLIESTQIKDPAAYDQMQLAGLDPDSDASRALTRSPVRRANSASASGSGRAGMSNAWRVAVSGGAVCAPACDASAVVARMYASRRRSRACTRIGLRGKGNPDRFIRNCAVS